MTTQTGRFDIRLKPETEDYIRKEAKRTGMTITEFLLHGVELHRKAQEQVNKQRSITGDGV
jgi:uncharacterized protein (DUF1778 family)